MKAVSVIEPGTFKSLDKPKPQSPENTDVLLKMRRLGICGTDLHAFRGAQPFFTYPRILGHEIAAEVLEYGSGVSHLKVGDLCSVIPYRNQVEDQAVRRGKTNCGSGLSVFGVHEDGAMQEFIKYPGHLILPANGLSLDQMAMLEPLAIGSHAVERAEIKEDDIVLVIGAGPIGIGTLSMALLKTNHVLALDMNTHRLEYVASRFPSVQTLAHSDDVADRLTAMLGGDLPTIIFDATGNKASMEKCFEYIAPAGTIVYIGLFIGDVTFHDPLFHKKEVTLKSSRNAVKDDFTKLINLFKTGKINIDGYITHRLSFDTIESSFTDLYDPDANVIKAVIDF